MNLSPRPTIENLMSALNVPTWPLRWNDVYDSVMDDYEKNGSKLLRPDYYDEIGEKYNIIAEYRDDYKRNASEIANDDALARYLMLMADTMRHRDTAKAEIKQIKMPKSDDGSYVEKYEILPALAMCETTDYTYSLVRDKNLPEDQLTYVMRRCDGTAMVSGYARRNDGRLGAINWGWFQLGVEAKLYKSNLLVLEMGRKFIPRATVFQNELGDVVTMAHDAVFHKDGYVLGTAGYEDEDGSFEPTLIETDDAFIGCAYNERGLAVNKSITLKKSEWKKVLTPDDDVIDIHIAAGTRLTDEIMTESFAEARELLATYFPEVDYKGFICTSWLLSPDLPELLGPNGNIVKFGNRFTKVAKKDPGTSVFSFVFLKPDVNNVDIESLPENTSLERALKKHYLDGKRLYDTFGYILK